MNITISKPRLTVLAILVIAANSFLFFFGPPGSGPQVKPEHPALILFTDTLLIGLGIFVQSWTRDKPKYKPVRLFAYFVTLLMCGALSFGLLATLLGRFF